MFPWLDRSLSPQSEYSSRAQSVLEHDSSAPAEIKQVAFQQEEAESSRRTIEGSRRNSDQPPASEDTPGNQAGDIEDFELQPQDSAEDELDSAMDEEQVTGESSDAVSGSRSSPANPNRLTLEQVLDSVANCYPEIEVAIGEIESANGKVLASWGEFDQIFSAHSISQPLGFYQTYRNGAGISRPLFSGGEVYGTYRIGDGNFEPWFGERETNEAGEFKAGFSIPLVKDRSIDERRAKLFSSGLQRDQVEANVEARLLMFQRFATQSYWDWVAAGQAVQIQQRLLKLAEQRVDQISERIEKGDLAEIARIDNDRFIAKRKNDLIKSQRLLEKTAIKLSLFWRDENCCPLIASESRLPAIFPVGSKILDGQLAADIMMALSVRPELEELRAAREEACVDLRYAQNLTLPKVDVKGFAGQDIGGETSSTGDKTPFELQIGVLAEVPIERRQGFGKIQAARGKITQIDAKTQFVSDKIRAEVQDAASAVNAAYEQILQSEENVRLTRRSLELGRLAFRGGDIDLLALNIYETSVADAELQLLEAQFKFFFYRAIYETAISGQF